MHSLYDKDQMIQFVQQHWPNTKRRAEQIVARYQTAILDEIIKNFPLRTASDKKFNLYLVSTHDLTHACGRYGSRGSEQYWWTILHKQFPYFTVEKKGYKNKALNKHGTLTKVKLKFTQNWHLKHMHSVITQAQQQPDLYDFVPIDLDSLYAYIGRAVSDELRHEAIKIMTLTAEYEHATGSCVLPMLKRPADSGRMYYAGTNLQNCSRVVRHASLGTHHSYDLRSSVYAWQIYMLRLIQDLDRYSTPAGTLCTRELLQDKTNIMHSLAGTLDQLNTSYDHKLKLIKQAITAIGFGARSANSYYDATGELVSHGLASIIFDALSRKQFLAHPWIKEFIHEQDSIGLTITKAMLDIAPELRTNPAIVINGKLSRKRLLAWLYQRSESEMIQLIMNEYAHAEILLWVHDGFCTRHAINLADANSLLMLEYSDGIQLVHTRYDTWADKPTEPDSSQERSQRHQEELAWHQSQGRCMFADNTEQATIKLAQVRAQTNRYQAPDLLTTIRGR